MTAPQPLRETLATLLRRWQRGELTPLEVLVAAEGLWERDPLSGQPQAPVFLRSDPKAIDYHVLWLLEVLHCDPLLPVDIPAILAFLETPPGQEAEAWRRWEAYWAAIDWEARRQAVGDLNSYLQTGQLVPRGAMEPVLAAAATCVAIGPYDDAR
jgi:hypothetical protein